MKKASLFLFILCVAFSFIFPSYCNQETDQLIDLEGLRKKGDDWEVLLEKSFPDGGSVKLHQSNWLMYFLHWRPLTTERENISVEYVQKLILSFWGPNMPFTLLDTGGEMEVAGHKAYFVDATIYQGSIRTRFIVWNCPETKRQFISDTNINVRSGTPLEKLDWQKDITLTIACHPGAKGQEFPHLKKKYTSEKYSLSFYIPEHWRTNDFNYPDWYKEEGVTEANGSLWTLLTDSEKYVEILWNNQQSKLSEELFQEFLKRIDGDQFEKDGITWKVIDMNLKKIESKDNYLLGNGTFSYHYQRGERESKTPFLFQAFLWNNNGKTFFMIAAMASLQEFWQIPFDLSPSKERFEQYLQDEVIPNVKVFNVSYE